MTSWFPVLLQGYASSNAIRSFRLLRPLRSISRFRGLKRLVTSMLVAMPQLVHLLIILLFLFYTMSCIGLQLWSGKWHQRCHICAGDLPTKHSALQVNTSLEFACQLHADVNTAAFCRMTDTPQGSCANEGEVCAIAIASPYFGVAGFDSLFSSFVVVLQLITFSSWQVCRPSRLPALFCYVVHTINTTFCRAERYDDDARHCWRVDGGIFHG